MVQKVLYALLAVTVVMMGLFGCTAGPDDVTVTQGVASGPVTVFGKIVDSETNEGIASATVYVKVNGTWVSSTTQKNTTGGAENLAGNFKIAGLPVDSELPMVIKGPSRSDYLQINKTIQTYDYSSGSDGVNSAINQDMGLIGMETGVVVTVRVVDSATGDFVARSDGAALPIEILPKQLWMFNPTAASIEVMTATQDATDSNVYTIVVPQRYNQAYDWDCDTDGATKGLSLFLPAQDTTGDGNWDYQTACVDILYSGNYLSQSSLTTNMVANKITNATVPAVLATNIKTAGDKDDAIAANEMDFVGASDSLMFVMNMPVELATSGTGSNVEVTYYDNFKTLTADAVYVHLSTTPALSADNTIVTVPFPASLTVDQNQTYAFTTSNVLVRALETVTADTVAAPFANETVTILATGAGTIGNSPSITVDNADYCTNFAAIIAGDPTMCSFISTRLVFPEPVWGKVTVISETVGSPAVTTYINSTVDLDGQGIDYLVSRMSTSASYLGNVGGYNRTGAVYSYDLGTAVPAVGAMPDNTSTSASSLKLEINVYDADGNVYHQIGDFAVQ